MAGGALLVQGSIPAMKHSGRQEAAAGPSNDGKVYLHLHVTVGRSDYSALAGHLLAATLNGAGEFVVEASGTAIGRAYDPETGLNCYKMDK